jgi:hypothetical protein
MPLKITCPYCRKPSHVGDADAGKVVACSECGKQMRLLQGPQPRTAPPPLPGRPEPVIARKHAEAAAPGPPPVGQPPGDDADEPDMGAERQQAHKARKLGPVLAAFRITESSLVWRTVLGVSVGLGGLTLTVLGVLACLETGRTSVGEAILGLVLCMGFGAAAVALSIYLLVRMARDRGKKVLLSRKGFAVVQRGRRTVYHWKDILAQYQSITEHYYNGAYTHTSHVYTLECVGGERVIFNDSLKNVKKLGEAVAEEITQRELPLIREQYDAGDLVPFGKLGVSRKGLTYGQAFLPWREVSGVRIHEGYVSVGKKGKWLNWCSIGAASIPNLFVFLALVDEIIGVKDD